MSDPAEGATTGGEELVKYFDAEGEKVLDFEGTNRVALFNPVPDVDHEGRHVSALDFQPLKGKHMRHFPAEGRTVGHTMDLAGAMCGQPPHIMDELSGQDLNVIGDLVNAFLARSPATGRSG